MQADHIKYGHIIQTDYGPLRIADIRASCSIGHSGLQPAVRRKMRKGLLRWTLLPLRVWTIGRKLRSTKEQVVEGFLDMSRAQTTQTSVIVLQTYSIVAES